MLHFLNKEGKHLKNDNQIITFSIHLFQIKKHN